MRWKHIGMLMTGVLCAAAAGSGPASAQDGDDRSTMPPPGSSGMTMDDVAKMYPGFVESDGKSWTEVIDDLSKPMDEAEAAAAAERTRRSSSATHYYPDAPEDARTEPPSLDDTGEEKIGSGN